MFCACMYVTVIVCARVCVCSYVFAFGLHPVRDFSYDIRIDANNKRINKCRFNNSELYSIDGVASSYYYILMNLISFVLVSFVFQLISHV